MLETHRSTDVHELELEAEHGEPGLRERMDGLRSQYFDEEMGLWRTETDKQEFTSEAQLLAAYVQSTYNSGGAHQLLERMRATKLYDKRRGGWRDTLAADGTLVFGTHPLSARLLQVILTARDDLQEAKRQFEALKNLPKFYQKKRKLWQEGAHFTFAGTDAQLLGVIAEAHFDRPAPLEAFETLRASYTEEEVWFDGWETTRDYMVKTQFFAAWAGSLLFPENAIAELKKAQSVVSAGRWMGHDWDVHDHLAALIASHAARGASEASAAPEIPDFLRIE